jgi:hypothetical protein
VSYAIKQRSGTLLSWTETTPFLVLVPLNPGREMLLHDGGGCDFFSQCRALCHTK